MPSRVDESVFEGSYCHELLIAKEHAPFKPGPSPLLGQAGGRLTRTPGNIGMFDDHWRNLFLLLTQFFKMLHTLELYFNPTVHYKTIYRCINIPENRIIDCACVDRVELCLPGIRKVFEVDK
jgi:hypothetical protein